MSTTTTKLGLIKPALTDSADITQYNVNWDIIDEELGKATNIPVTSEVPADSEIWIDPNEISTEESHIANMNNPHNVTTAQIGAVPTSRTINGMPLTKNIVITAEDLGVSGGEGLGEHLNDFNNPHNVTAEQVGAASATHKHSMADINSGTLPITQGGTGATDAENARKNLGMTGAITSVVSNDFSAGKAIISNSSGKFASSDITATELGYLDGVTSNIQTQLDGKAASSHGTHVSYGTSTKALGTAAAGTATTVSRSDHVHALPALTSCTGTLSVAKGGTGATTADAALANLGGTKFELLWENASPLAAFGAQSIKIENITTNYRMILIDCLEHWSAGAWRWYHASAIAQTNLDAGYGNGTPGRVMSFGEEGCDISYRPFTIYSGSVYFASGYYATTFSTSNPSTSNNVLVPLRIYGIK